MIIFIMAGVMYLVGIAIILIIRPLFMFTPDGDWKEFGIGQRDDRYTPFPFWLFCIVWAIVSYITMLVLIPMVVPRSVLEGSVETDEVVMPLRNRRNRNRIQTPLEDYVEAPEPVELPKGYYVLNKKATKLSGVPKYVYLGPEEPSE